VVELAEAEGVLSRLDMRLLVDVDGNAVWVNDANVSKWLKHN